MSLWHRMDTRLLWGALFILALAASVAIFLATATGAFAQTDVPDAPTDLAVYSIETQKLEVRWSTADAADTTSFKVQWKSGSEEFDSTRQLTSDPATSIESDQSTSAGDRYVDTITGLTDGTEYTVRVTATNSNGDSEASATETGTPASQPSQAREFWENEVVKVFEDSSPWLRETWDHITTRNASVVWAEGEGYHGEALVLCSYSLPSKVRECYADRVSISRSYPSLIYGIAHELAHVYTLANNVTATPGPLGVARLYFHELTAGGSKGGSFCIPVELFADAVVIVTLGDRYVSSDSYWASCSLTTDTVTAEALTVVRSALSGQMPSWFADTYHDTDGNPDLERVWRDVKAISAAIFKGGGYRATAVFQLRDSFGGYCDNQKATDSAFGSGVTVNPWRDGGCVPGAPANVSVTPVGSGKLTVSWQGPPVEDGGSPIEGYKVQWKSGAQDYSPTRQILVTSLTEIVSLQAISGLTNDESHTIRLLAYNHNGDGAGPEVTATPTATDTTAPVLLLTRFDSRSVRLIWDEALDESSKPAASAFTVNANGVEGQIYEVAVLGNAVWLSVEGAITPTDQLTVRYVAPTGSGATPLKDSAGNSAPGIATRTVRNDRIQIVITDPGPDKTHILGRGFGSQDSIEATVTFSEPVTVKGVPELNLEVGGQALLASYHSGSGTSSLVFRYQLNEGETDSEGIWIRSSGNISKIRGPGVVRYASSKAVAPARLWSSLRTDYLVDAVRPTLVSANAVADGHDLDLRWDKALDEDSATKTHLFTVEDTSDNSSIDVTAVSVQDRVVTLTLSSAVSATDQLTVSYFDPFGRTSESDLMQVNHIPLKDTLGNHAAVSSVAVAITLHPNSPPEFSSAEDGARSVDENTPAGRNIGAPIAAADADGNRRTYSISGTDAAFFDVVASSGQLRTKAALNYDARDSYSFTMSVHDGRDIHGNRDTTVDSTITVTVTVTRGCFNAGRPPCAPSRPSVSSASDTSLRVTWSAPRTPSGTSVTGYELQYKEADDGGSWMFATVVGTDRSHTIEDLVKDTVYEVQVRAMNDSSGYGDWSLAGTGTPGVVFSPPSISGGGGFGPAPVAPKFVDGFRTERSIAENARPEDPIGDPVDATHPDDLDITYSLSGAAAASFTVDEESGQVRVREGVGLTPGESYTVNLTATDSAGVGAIIIVVIEVTEATHHTYDLDRSGTIDRNEVVAAVKDYFDGLITKDEVIELVKLYFAESG